MKPGQIRSKSRIAEVQAALKRLTRDEVLIGIPRETAKRTTKDEEGNEVASPVNSAQLLYIHEFGSPARNIPERPVLRPSVAAIRDKAIAVFKVAAQRVLAGQTGEAERALHYVGLMGQTAAQQRITDGIAPPLADSTLRRRAARKAGKGHLINKGAMAELASRAAGNAHGMEFTTPLIDTGAMRQAIKYAIRRRK